MMNRHAFLVAIAIAAVVCVSLSCAPKSVEYATPTTDRTLVFPWDDYAHPEYKTEWWYYTGHVADAEGNRFGFELVFFRRRSETDTRFGIPVRWYGNPVYVGHFAITDFARGEHRYAESFGREKRGQAGAELDAFHVWVNDWSAERFGDLVRLQASMKGGYSIDLALRPTKPPVINGEGGISRKGEGGGVSYYISTTRLAVEGTLVAGGAHRHVVGSAWNDHEILSPEMAKTIRGWDWFSLQFDDDTELMLFHLNRRDGGVDPLSAGTYVRADGTYETFLLDDFEIHATGYWTSPHSGARYPAGWVARVPKLGIEIAIRPSVDDQEVHAVVNGVRYWEGSVQVRGTANGKAITGLGYCELTGYDEPVDQL